MKQSFDLIVVIPVGPYCFPENIEDTIGSFIHYTKSTYKIILADDSQIGTGWGIQKKFPDIDVVKMPASFGKLCGLYVTLSLAFQHALSNFHFKALLRMDTDALIIGPDPELDAIRLFQTDRKAGIAGQYMFDYDGQPRNIEWPRQRIINGTRTWKFIRRPFANWALRKLYRRALSNGYVTGENVFGGAYFMSEACLHTLHEAGLLPDYKLRTLNLEEDHLFGLLVKACGFNLADLSTEHKPFGCAWKGLPAAPEQLCKDDKKIVHSTRFWENMKEEEIRTYFRQKRDASGYPDISPF